MTKVASAILILREGNATDWTPDLDNQMVSWVQEYIQWLETANQAIQESDATKCVVHGCYSNAKSTERRTVIMDPTIITNSRHFSLSRKTFQEL